MALMYSKAKKKFLDADLDLLADTIKAVLLKASHTPNNAHEFLADVTGADMVGTAQTLASKDTTDGVFNAASITFLAVGATGACDKVLIYKDTGNAATSPVIAAVDLTASVTPNGGNITVDWSTGASKIFRLN